MRRPSVFQRARSGSIFKSFNAGRKRRGSRLSDREDGIPEVDESDDDDANERSALRKQNSRDQEGYNSDRRSSMDQGRRKSIGADDAEDQALSVLYDEGITLKKRAISLYTSLCELRSYVQLNKTGFTKVLKKYDKTLDRKLKSTYVKSQVEPAYPFLPSTTQTITDNIAKVEKTYADVVTKGDVERARQELRLHLREHVVWERNTVWREMIGIERKAQAANMGIRQMMLGQETDPRKARLQGDDPDSATKEVETPIGRYRCPAFLFSSTFYTLIVIIAIFIVLLLVPIMKKPEQQNLPGAGRLCQLVVGTRGHSSLRHLVACAFSGGGTSGREVRQQTAPSARVQARGHLCLCRNVEARHHASPRWLHHPPRRLSKYNIAKIMATFVLSKAGTKPRTVLLTSMFVAMFASMWISNVAAPVLCFSIIQVSASHQLADCPH